MKIPKSRSGVILSSSILPVTLKRQRYLEAAQDSSSSLNSNSSSASNTSTVTTQPKKSNSSASKNRPQQQQQLVELEDLTNEIPRPSSERSSHKNSDTSIQPSRSSLQRSKSNGSNMPKARNFAMGGWLTPRPLMVSMLNNKGVVFIEREQYEEARKSLHRALKIAEKEGKQIEAATGNEAISDRTSNTFAVIAPDSGECIAIHKKNKTKKPLSSSTTLSSFKDEPSSQTFDAVGKKHKKKSTKSGSKDKTKKTPAQQDAITNNAAICPSDSDVVSPLDHVSKVVAESEAAGASKSLKHRSEYDEGMDYFRQPFRLHETSTCLDGTVLFNLARVSHNQGNLNEALDLYKRTLLSLERRRRAMVPASEATLQKDERSSSITLAVLVCVANIQYIRGEHQEALNTFMAADAVARTNFGEESLEVAACLNCIGVLHYIMPDGDDETMIDSLQTSLQIRITLLGDDHIDVGTTWNNVGRSFFQQCRYQLAMEAYLEALRIRRKCQGESVDVAATIFNVGQVHHQQENRDKALKLYQEFLTLAKSHFGEFHRDICIVTTCIGQVLHEMKEYERALKSFHHALRIGHVALGPAHSEIAITLNKMGNLYYETGDFDSALKAYHEGLAMEKVVLEPGNANVYVTYTNIAEIHKQRNELGEALKYYQEVLDLQKEHNADTLEIANTLSSIGYIRHQMNDYDDALEVNQECLRLRREAKGDNDEDVASTLTHIALVLLKLERHDIALEVLTEAYRVRKEVSKPNNRDLAFTLYNIALIYHHRGSHEEALAFYLATAEVEKSALGNNHRDLSITFYNIGQIYYQRGEMEMALEKFNEALAIEKECFGEEHATCARTLNEIGNIHLQLGDLPKMMECYTQALRIYKSTNTTNEHVVVYGLKLWRFNVVQPVAAAVA